LLPKLNFPQYDFRFKKNATNGLLIFDEIRKKFVELSPEEWVRQHLILYLIKEKKFPASLFSVEKGLKLNNTHKRTDILIYNTNKKITLLAECKAPSVQLTKTTAEQALRYNLVHKSPFLILTNGLTHLFFQLEGGTKIKQLADCIDYEKITPH